MLMCIHIRKGEPLVVDKKSGITWNPCSQNKYNELCMFGVYKHVCIWKKEINPNEYNITIEMIKRSLKPLNVEKG
jgi:hypothetical protein